ncbi:uncharacterized protein TNCV_142691 [Trichonephila clavipes]|nr:uncharacterized protein TNCV_142691 [Trichonephila clavipes]
MMEVGWSARRVARQLGRSACVVRRCWDQWIREMPFTRRPGSRRPLLTNHREDHHIVRNARVKPTASSATIQAQVAASLGPLDADCSGKETGLQWNGTGSSLATNPESISALMTIEFVCGDPVVNASTLPLLYSETPLLLAGVMVWVPMPTIHGHP